MRNLTAFDILSPFMRALTFHRNRRLAAVWAHGLLLVCASCDCHAVEETSPAFSANGSTNFSFYLEHVLGTSLQWTVCAPNRSIAEESEQWILSEIQRMSDALSRHDPSSELSRLPCDAGSQTSLSVDLARVLSAAEEYRINSGGAFDIRVSWFERLRRSQSAIQQLRGLGSDQITTSAGTKMRYDSQDSSQELMIQREQIDQNLKDAPYRIEQGSEGSHRLLVLQDILATWTLDGIAKGYILDQVADKAQLRFPEISGGCLNIGGDLRLFGDFSLGVSIEDPFRAHEGDEPLITWNQSTPLAIATSGGYRRRMKEGSSSSSSHLIDPRTGLSAEGLASVTVVAGTAMDADAMATTISVLGREEGLRWIESLQDPAVACLLVDSSGQIYTSSKWHNITNSPVPIRRPSIAALSNALTLVSQQSLDQLPSGLHVWFELTRPTGATYRRPYLAIWLEDQEGFPVKTGALWLQTDQPGPRWHRDLTRWYRNDRMRKLAEKSDLIETVSSATRGPGKYEVHFDGTDNQGNPLPPGTYTLLIEVAREHGTYQLIRQRFQWDDQSIERTELEGNAEITKAAFQFQPREATGAN